MHLELKEKIRAQFFRKGPHVSSETPPGPCKSRELQRPAVGRPSYKSFEMESPSAESFKELGNALFNGKDLLNALEAYSKGIIQDPSNYILFSNRSRCNAALEDFEAALAGETFPLA